MDILTGSPADDHLSRDCDLGDNMNKRLQHCQLRRVWFSFLFEQIRGASPTGYADFLAKEPAVKLTAPWVGG